MSARTSLLTSPGNRRLRASALPLFAGHDVELLVAQWLLRSGAIGIVRRWCLIAGGRLRQRVACRLALELGGFGGVALEHAHEAAVVAELRGAQGVVGAVATGLKTVRTAHVALARGPAGIELTR